MKDKKLKKYVHYVLLCGLGLVVAFAALYLAFGGVWGKLCLGALLALPAVRLVTEIYGFCEERLYRFALISAVLMFMLAVEYFFLK